MKTTAIELKEKLIRSVKKNNASGLLFSGGLDSSIIACLDPNLTAVSVSLESFGEDIQYSQLAAKKLRLKHIHKTIGIEEAIAAIPEVIKILNTFDPALPNDLAAFFGIRYAEELGINKVATGDGSDELFGGYSFMQEINNLSDYIKKITRCMRFSSNIIAEHFNLLVKQPYLDKEIVDLALRIPADLKIRKDNNKIWGKWILRKAFENLLPSSLIWQSKRPLEYGSGMVEIRRIISDMVSDEEFYNNPYSIKFITKDHLYYYKIYKKLIGEVPKPKADEKPCPNCTTGMVLDAFHCKICGYVLN